MAIKLFRDTHWSETAHFFETRAAMFDAIRGVEGLKASAEGHYLTVREYSIEKFAHLTFERHSFGQHHQKADLASLVPRAAECIIDSDHFGMPRISYYAEITLIIKVYLEAHNLSALPSGLRRIGSHFIEHMADFTRLVGELTKIGPVRRKELMSAVVISKPFVDQFIGQFVHEFFCFMSHGGHLVKALQPVRN
jgi:hypothetical protein